MTLLEKINTSDDSDTLSFHHREADGSWSGDGFGYDVKELKVIADKAAKWDAMNAELIPPDHNC